MPITTILTKHGKVGGASGGEVPLTTVSVVCLLFNNLGEGRGTEFCLLLSNLEEGRGTKLGEGAALSRSLSELEVSLGRDQRITHSPHSQAIDLHFPWASAPRVSVAE